MSFMESIPNKEKGLTEHVLFEQRTSSLFRQLVILPFLSIDIGYVLNIRTQYYVLRRQRNFHQSLFVRTLTLCIDCYSSRGPASPPNCIFMATIIVCNDGAPSRKRVPRTVCTDVRLWKALLTRSKRYHTIQNSTFLSFLPNMQTVVNTYHA